MRNKTVLFILFLVLFFSSQLLPAAVKIVYPGEKSHLPYLRSSFIFGFVQPATATLLIEGSTIPVYTTGSFIAMIPFHPGKFEIHARTISDGIDTECVRTITVSSPEAALPADPLQIDSDSIQPSSELKMLPHEKTVLRFKGTPHCQASYRLIGTKHHRWKKEWFPMEEEISSIPGIYETLFTVPELKSHKSKTLSFEFRLTHSNGKSVTIQNNTAIQVLDPDHLPWVETEEETVLKTGPAIGSDKMDYDLILPKGILLRKNGQKGKESRLLLSSDLSEWTDSKNLKSISSPMDEFNSILDTIQVDNSKRLLVLKASLSRKVPYRLRVSNDLRTLKITFFNTLSNIDRMKMNEETDSPFLEGIHWQQTNNETLDLECRFKEKVWGYEPKYEGNRFVLLVHFSPIINRKNPLENLKVMVDPGHSPEPGDGAISPQGILEGTVNYSIALRLKKKLQSEGAHVFLTRGKNEIVSLQDRSRRAIDESCDLFISIHANALPDGANPFERHGFSVYYYQPFSFEFARSVHSAYQQNSPLPDDGLYFGNLSVCRITQMPSILTESAYLIHPEEEELLLDEKFQNLVAQTITEGTLHFLKSW